MNQAKLGSGTLTINDPETGETYTLELEHARALVSDALAHCPDTELAAKMPQELRDALANGGTFSASMKLDTVNHKALQAIVPQVLEVTAQPNPAAREHRGMVAPNRKERRAEQKRQRSKVIQKAESKRLEGVRKQMQARFDAEREANELFDKPFADPRHIGKIAQVFDPVGKLLESLHAGEIACMPDGTPLFFDAGDGCHYPAADSLESLVATYDKLGRTHGWSDHLDGLRMIVIRLRDDEPISQEDVDAARKTVEWLKYCTLTITPRQFAAEAQEIQIRNEFQAQGLAP